jgi:hypothetical protein
MYQDDKNTYYDWNGGPIAVPHDGSPPRIWLDGAWQTQRGKVRSATWFLMPGGDATPYEDEAEFKRALLDADKPEPEPEAEAKQEQA